MVLKFYGFDQSTCSKRVAVTLLEKEVPFEFVQVDMMTGKHKSPEFLAHQPFGQVPYIVTEDGFTLYESRAIMRYIEATYPSQGTSLVPSDPKARALFEQAASIESTNFDPYAAPITFEKVFAPMFGLTPNEERVEKLKKEWAGKLDVYETILSKQKYLAGDSITLADLAHLPYGMMCTDAVGLDVLTSPSRPNVARWWADISSRPSWLAVKGGIKGTA